MLHVTHKPSILNQAEMKHLLCNKPASAHEWFSGSGWAESGKFPAWPPTAARVCICSYNRVQMSLKRLPAPAHFCPAASEGRRTLRRPLLLVRWGEVRDTSCREQNKSCRGWGGMHAAVMCRGTTEPPRQQAERKVSEVTYFSLIPPWNVRKLFGRKNEPDISNESSLEGPNL